MDFSNALIALKEGKKVTNGNWNGKDMYIAAQFPDENSKMTRPYLYIKDAQDNFVPWLCAQHDLFSENWEIFED